jgi:hypothetical protein
MEKAFLPSKAYPSSKAQFLDLVQNVSVPSLEIRK